MTAASDPLDALARACYRRLAVSGAPLFDVAEAERVAPILYYWFLRRGYPGSVSASDRQRFRAAYYRSAGRNVELLSALADVASVLNEHDIPSVAFKGADLSKRLYPNVALRPMGDLDVYVSPENAERAELALAGSGFRPWSPDMTPGLSRRIRHARLYVGGRDESISVDLHWSLVGHGGDARAPERDWIDEHTRPSGSSWRCLSETAHLLYLAAHMKLQHYDEPIPLLWLVDFQLLAASGKVDWSVLFADGERFGWTEAVRASAFDVRERLGVTLPSPLDEVARAPSSTLHRDGARHEPERVLNELATLGWAGRLALVRAYVLPSASYLRYRYPAASLLPSWARWAYWPLAYSKRWGEVTRKGLGLAARALAPRARTRPLLAGRETC